MFQRFQSTRLILTENELADCRPGQWVRLTNGARGQYLGTTTQGVIVVRWQRIKFGTQGKDQRTDARQNGILRQYARTYGAN